MVEVYQSPGATNPRPEDIRQKQDITRDARWWTLKEDERPAVVHSIVDRIFRQSMWRHQAYRRYMRMYNNMLGMMWNPGLTGGLGQSGVQKLSLNVVKSCADTFVSKMTLERPKCTFLTSGGDWTLQNKAKDLEKFVDGQFYEMKLYEDTPSVVLHSCVTGLGAYKILVDGDLRSEETAKDAKVIGEVTPTWEIGVDNRDAQRGKPRTMVQVKSVDRLQLMAMFPEKADQIAKARAPEMGEDKSFPMWMMTDDSISDMVQVNMIWHLPSSPSSNDGWEWIGTSECQLSMREWKHNYFPFAFYRRMPPLAGFYGIGLAEELRGIQQDINMMIQKAQQAIHLFAVPKWFLQGNSQVSTGVLNNGVEIIRGMTPPQPLLPPAAMPPDFWQHLERQYQRAFEICGVNQMQAMAQKPAGLNSGRAQDTYIDIVSERFAVASRNYHDFVLECGRQVVDRARDITKIYKKYSVISVSKSSSQSVEFLKTDLSKEEAVLQMYPTNKLSRDPAERMAQVEQMINSGLVDPNDAPRLLEFPDLEQQWNLKYASYEMTMWMIDEILNEGNVHQPQPFMNLDETMKWATLKLMYATRCKAPENNLQMLREWIQTVDEMQKAAAPPPPPPAPPGMGAPPPPGGPMPPPDAGMAPPGMPPPDQMAA